LISSVSSVTVNITCKSTVTGYTNRYVDIKICKWVSNDVDYYETSATAENACSKFVPSYNLYSTGNITSLRQNNTNDQLLLKQYIGSSACGR
jgi:hypothetical protein